MRGFIHYEPPTRGKMDKGLPTAEWTARVMKAFMDIPEVRIARAVAGRLGCENEFQFIRMVPTKRAKKEEREPKKGVGIKREKGKEEEGAATDEEEAATTDEEEEEKEGAATTETEGSITSIQTKVKPLKEKKRLPRTGTGLQTGTDAEYTNELVGEEEEENERVGTKKGKHSFARQVRKAEEKQRQIAAATTAATSQPQKKYPQSSGRSTSGSWIMLPESAVSQAAGMIAGGARQPFVNATYPYRQLNICGCGETGGGCCGGEQQQPSPPTAWHVAPCHPCVLVVDVQLEANVNKSLARTRQRSGLRDLRLEEITEIQPDSDFDNIFGSFVELAACEIRLAGLVSQKLPTRFMKARIEETYVSILDALGVLSRVRRARDSGTLELAPPFDWSTYDPLENALRSVSKYY